MAGTKTGCCGPCPGTIDPGLAQTGLDHRVPVWSAVATDSLPRTDDDDGVFVVSGRRLVCALTGPARSPFVIDGLFAFVSRAFCFRSMSLFIRYYYYLTNSTMKVTRARRTVRERAAHAHL